MVSSVAQLLLTSVLTMGVTLYPPAEDRIADDFERLVALTDLPVLKKPYGYSLVASTAGQLRESHPQLYERIVSELTRIEGSSCVLQGLAVESGFHAESPGRHPPAIPNQHGRTVNAGFAAQATGFVTLGRAVRASLDLGVHRRDAAYEAVYPNSFVAVGFPFLQVDVGFRDHWYSPAQASAIAVSTHAVNSPSITVSNGVPLTRARVMYEIFFARLESTSQIWFEDAVHQGHPRLVGLHLSLAPVSWMVIGGNRTLQFGGGPRDPVSAWDVIRALFFPHRYDNRGGGLSRDEEIGNQIGSLAIAANYTVAGVRLRVYGEIGADDTASQRIYFFGNPLATVGLFLPTLTDELSLRYEYSEGQNRWYEHRVYLDGYRNRGRVMGHWMYDFNEEGIDNEVEASLHAVRLVWTEAAAQVAGTLRRVSVSSFSGIAYSTGYEAELVVRRTLGGHVEGQVWLYGGVTPRRETFTMLSFGLRLF